MIIIPFDWIDFECELLARANIFLLQLMEGFVDHASNFMAYVHSSVNDTCRMMLQSDGRYAYTTPKSFLEQLQLFCRLLEKQTTTFKSNIERLDNGLDRLRVAAVQVDELKEMLAIQEVDLQRKTEEAERLIQVSFDFRFFYRESGGSTGAMYSNFAMYSLYVLERGRYE